MNALACKSLTEIVIWEHRRIYKQGTPGLCPGKSFRSAMF